MADAFVDGTILDDKFKVHSVLGTGGMATVYQAEQVGTGRPVALKVLHCASLEPGTVKRFMREAQILGRLKHPNILSAYSVGLTEQQQPYLVVEVLQGDTLAEVIAREGGCKWERIYSIMGQVCDGLSHAHAEGVVHRDLKPANIFLTHEQDSSESVRILDFGIAAFSEAKPEQQLTQTGVIFGTPAYMSPEQCAGMKSSQACDIYALGCILYEMCTGSPPFTGETVMEVMYKQINDSLPKFDPKDKAIPQAVARVIANATIKDPERRYQTVSQFFKDLSNVKAGKPVKSLSAARKINKSVLVAVCLLACIVFGGAAYLSIPRNQAELKNQIGAQEAPLASFTEVQHRLRPTAEELIAADAAIHRNWQSYEFNTLVTRPVQEDLIAAYLYNQAANRDPAGGGELLWESIRFYRAALELIEKDKRAHGIKTHAEWPVRVELTNAYIKLLQQTQPGLRSNLFAEANEVIGPIAALGLEADVAMREAAYGAQLELLGSFPELVTTEQQMRLARAMADDHYHAMEQRSGFQLWSASDLAAKKKWNKALESALKKRCVELGLNWKKLR